MLRPPASIIQWQVSTNFVDIIIAGSYYKAKAMLNMYITLIIRNDCKRFVWKLDEKRTIINRIM